MIALFDTNILIDHLRSHPQALVEMSLYRNKAISIVTWIEVMVGAKNQDAITRNFLDDFEVLNIDADVAERAVHLRRERRIKFPDSVIWATAQSHGFVLVTRNTKDFPADDPGIRMPYVLQ